MSNEARQHLSGRLAGPSSGSQTITVDQADVSREGQADSAADVGPVGVLHLRATAGTSRHVVWSEETIDNEGMGKKKSKICCIYHKPKAFDESSEESSQSDSASDSESADEGSDSSASSHDGTSSEATGMNASKALREKREPSRKGKKGKHREGQNEERCEHDGCTHGARTRKTKKSTGSRGGRTVTLTETGPSKEHDVEHGHADDGGRPKPNTYERGLS